jgi:hypothetical protein
LRPLGTAATNRNADVAPPLLETALDVGEQSASHLGRFSSAEAAPDRRVGGPQSRSGRYGEEKNVFPSRVPAIQPLTRRYTE